MTVFAGLALVSSAQGKLQAFRCVHCHWSSNEQTPTKSCQAHIFQVPLLFPAAPSTRGTLQVPAVLKRRRVTREPQMLSLVCLAVCCLRKRSFGAKEAPLEKAKLLTVYCVRAQKGDAHVKFSPARVLVRGLGSSNTFSPCLVEFTRYLLVHCT